MATAQDRSQVRHDGGAPDGNAKDDAAGTGQPLVGEFVFALVLMLGIATVLFQGLQLPFFQPDGAIGAAFFPVTLSLLMMAVIGGYMARLGFAWLRQRRTSAVAKPIGGDPLVTRDQFILCGLIVLSVIVGGYIGLLATSGLVLAAGLLVIERVGLRAAILFTIGTLVCIYLIFDLWLGMNVGLRGLF